MVIFVPKIFENRESNQNQFVFLKIFQDPSSKWYMRVTEKIKVQTMTICIFLTDTNNKPISKSLIFIKTNKCVISKCVVGYFQVSNWRWESTLLEDIGIIFQIWYAECIIWVNLLY